MSSELIDLIDSLIETSVVFVSIGIIFPGTLKYKDKVFRFLMVLAGFGIGNAVVIYLINDSDVLRFILYAVLMVAASALYGILISNDDGRAIFVLALYLNSTVIQSKTISQFLENDIARRLLQYAILFLIIFYYVKVSHPISIQISNGYWAVIMAAPMVIFAMITLYNSERDHRAGLIKSMGFVVLECMIYFLFMRLIKETEQQMELMLSNETMSFEIRQMKTVETQLESVRKARHELKNNYFLLDTYLVNKDYEGLEECLHKDILPSLNSTELVNTGNRFVDMILSQKASEAQQSNIPIVFDIYIPEEIHINRQMLGSLLFNLLDNAIEASQKVKEPDIHFYMHEKNGYLSIEARNHIEGSVLKHNPELLTSKKDSANHGMGTRIIRQIVQRCDGNIKFTEEDGSFAVKVLLPDR